MSGADTFMLFIIICCIPIVFAIILMIINQKQRAKEEREKNNLFPVIDEIVEIKVTNFEPVGNRKKTAAQIGMLAGAVSNNIYVAAAGAASGLSMTDLVTVSVLFKDNTSKTVKITVNEYNVIYTELEKRKNKAVINTLQKDTAEMNYSAADELKKFAKLRDQNIITDEEFQVKKKQIIGNV